MVKPPSLIPVTAIGMSGTREGMTPAQFAQMKMLLAQFRRLETVQFFDHGDCIGADDQMDDAAWDLGYHIRIHPPFDAKYRAFCHHKPGRKAGDPRCQVRAPHAYRLRNLNIIKATQILLAAPKDMHLLHHKLHGGTWTTIRYARARGQPLAIVYGNGALYREGWDSFQGLPAK
jgi:hypothetical protein